MPDPRLHDDVPCPAPMRVVRIITRLNIGGPSIQAINLSLGLRTRGIQTLLLHGRLGRGEGDMAYLLPPNDPSVEYVPTLQRPIAVFDDLRTFFTVLSALRRYRPAIVHTHMAKAGAIGRLAAVVYRAMSRPRVRLVHTYHGHVLDGYFSRLAEAVFVRLERLLARGTDILVAISPQVRHELVNQYRIGRPGQFRVVPLGFDLTALSGIGPAARQRARADLGLPVSAPVIAWVGRLTAIKQPALFLQMATRVTQRFPETTFLIAGDGELRHDLEAEAATLGLQRSVRFLGWRKDLATIYGASDVFALTSRNEGTPVALIEAMAAGVASVCTDVGGVRDVLDHGRVGRLVPSGTADDLAAAACQLLESADLRGRLGVDGRATVVSRYNQARLFSDIEQLYRDLVRESGIVDSLPA